MLSIRWSWYIFVLFCLMVIEPWLVKGDFSCYAGTVDILNGELNVASTKSIVVQQCSPPTTQQPPSSPTPGVSSTMRPATPQSDNQTVTTPPSATSAGNQTTHGTASASPEALLVTDTKPERHNESAASPPPGTTATSASVTASPSTPKVTPGTAAETPSATSTTPLQTRESGGSVLGCVVTKSYHGSSGDNLTADFSCPASDSPCAGIGFNGSTGADNQTQCCVGTLCNTLDSFIMREHFSYSKVDSCFVGMTDANETQCGDSSNMCLTIIDSSQGTTEYYCGNVTLQRYCQQNGTLREGSFKQENLQGENITVRCCGSSNCNTPILPSTTIPPSTSAILSSATTPSRAIHSSTAAPASSSSPLSTAAPASSSSPLSTAAPASSSSPLSTAAPLNMSTTPPTGTPPPTANSSSTASPPAPASPSSSTVVPSSGASSPFTGANATTSVPSASAGHSNKSLIIGIVVAFVVGLLGGVVITVICCRRRNNSVARPGELLSFDNFHYKRMGADEVSEEVFMS